MRTFKACSVRYNVVDSLPSRSYPWVFRDDFNKTRVHHNYSINIDIFTLFILQLLYTYDDLLVVMITHSLSSVFASNVLMNQDGYLPTRIHAP